MRHPTEQERAAILKDVPKFELRSQEVYKAMARALRDNGACCTWADVRLADMQEHFPKKEDITDTATVRAVHLWSLAYQQQLVADLDSPHEEIRVAAEREIVRIGSWRDKPLHHVPGGKA